MSNFKHSSWQRRRDGFTLVELLGVILVIAILMGMTFKIVGYAALKADRARALEDIEAIRQALEEYYALYGVYPPTFRTVYEHRLNDPAAPPDAGLHYKTGLYWYLTVGPGHGRWDRYLDEVARTGGMVPYTNDVSTPPGGGVPTDVNWSNSTANFATPWGGGYSYRVGQDFQSYRIWSGAPPGSSEGVGDIPDQSFLD